MRATARAALAAIALCAVAAGAEQDDGAPSDDAPMRERTKVLAPPPAADAVLRVRALDPQLVGAESFLRANVQDATGAWGYVHFTPEDTPIVVAVGMPKEPPRLASSAEGREAALEGVRVWVRALRPHLPWFAVRFVESDPGADVEIVWKRRMTAGAAGRGRMEYLIEDGRVRARGSLALSTRPHPRGPALTTEQIERLVAHEFGHALGLDHCLDCDSAMNYSWQTRERVFVTAADVKTYLLLLAQPNGLRHEGGPLAGVTRPGWSLGAE